MIPGSLYVVATPIGNLGDASPRAIEALRAADLIACEDTRTSRTLLARHAIPARTVALHEHNERAAAAKLLQAMHAGKNVALISDAGTPALSDPGALAPMASKASSCWCSRRASPGRHRLWRPNACSKRCWRLWRRARRRGSLRASPGFQGALCTAGRSSAPSRIRSMDRLTLRRPDDWHLHLRDGPAMASVLADSARRFARAIVMPNLKPPVRTTQQALEYRERILRALPPRTAFEPLMTLYLTDDTPPEEIALAKRSGRVFGVKLYPAGATTHSDEGVTRLSRCFHALEKMTEVGMPLLVHGESTDPAIDVFDREKAFIEEVLGPLVERFPRLKVVLEHITTRDAVQYIEVTGPNIAATITAHHLLMNRNALFMGGIRPHHYCLPVLKREDHREALVEAAASGNPKFFLGTDSAPHARHAKETACGCAGIRSEE